MDNIKFRNLRADEIEVRVSDKKNGKMSLLIYKDARVDANILDETVGQFGWACQFKEEKGTLFAGIALKAEDGTWIWKWDAGAPSNFEKEKGEASDAFKRAAFKWGIGRSLYTAPKIMVPESNATHKVSKIDYDTNGKIRDLQIVDWNGKAVFNYVDGRVSSVPTEPKTDRVAALKAFCRQKADEGESTYMLKKFHNFYEGKIPDWQTEPDFERLLDKWKERE